MKENLKNLGFEYNSELDEWFKPTFGGNIIIWEKLNSSNWAISYEDFDDFLYPVFEGKEYQIIDVLTSFERDKKLEELLNS
jgi:hypothetical protein